MLPLATTSDAHASSCSGVESLNLRNEMKAGPFPRRAKFISVLWVTGSPLCFRNHSACCLRLRKRRVSGATGFAATSNSLVSRGASLAFGEPQPSKPELKGDALRAMNYLPEYSILHN